MVPLTTPEVWVAGRPLTGQVWWGDLVITHRWPYGCWDLSWGMSLKPYQRIPGFVADASVRVRFGSGRIWAGNLSEPDWDSDTMSAVGAARQGETTLALTGAGETSAIPDTAVDAAIARGAVDWGRISSFSTAAFGGSSTTERLNYLTALMDAWSTSEGKRWGVDAYRRVYAAADPTTPSLYVRPGAGVLGVTDQTKAASIVGRYQTSGGTFASVTVGSGRPEVGVFLGKHGVLTAPQATAVITGMRDQLQSTTGWSNGLTLTTDQITNPGGVRASLDQVVAGKMVRLLGLRDERGAEASTDFVIGESIWNVSAGTVQANPVGMVGNDLSSVIEAGGGELL